MSDFISRRTFIKGTTLLGASTLLAGSPISVLEDLAYAANPVDLAAVSGADYFKDTVTAIGILGGMKQFVTKQARVGLLINSPWRHPGSYVTPEIPLAVVRMCLDAGAKEVGVFKSTGNAYWSRSSLSKSFRNEISLIRDLEGDFTEVAIPAGKALKKAQVAKSLLECDVFINISIAKDHTGTRFSGTMKNMMGASSYETNRFFHHGSGASGSYDDVEFLSQCIADLNLVRKPDLCILDGTEVLKTNGPAGPGKLLKPQKVIAGLNRVSIDAYGARLIGVNPEEVRMIRMAQEHGLGESRLQRLQIRETVVSA
jgi:uncharacterized protein (DUF362 family)